jgi:hypothetical protein
MEDAVKSDNKNYDFAKAVDQLDKECNKIIIY